MIRNKKKQPQPETHAIFVIWLVWKKKPLRLAVWRRKKPLRIPRWIFYSKSRFFPENLFLAYFDDGDSTKPTFVWHAHRNHYFRSSVSLECTHRNFGSGPNQGGNFELSSSGNDRFRWACWTKVCLLNFSWSKYAGKRFWVKNSNFKSKILRKKFSSGFFFSQTQISRVFFSN